MGLGFAGESTEKKMENEMWILNIPHALKYPLPWGIIVFWYTKVMQVFGIHNLQRVQTWARVLGVVWIGLDFESRFERFLPCKHVKLGGGWLAVEVSPAL